VSGDTDGVGCGDSRTIGRSVDTDGVGCAVSGIGVLADADGTLGACGSSSATASDGTAAGFVAPSSRPSVG
jgi:hypothetical protein